MSAWNAVLFDLDGTLLENNLDVFLPRYFQRLSARVSNIVPPKEFVGHLMAATQVMLGNDGRDTNEAVFAQAFYPRLGHSRAEMEPIFLDFYRHEFPALREFTGRRPEARLAVQSAFDLGYQVVVATNPLFPEIAMRERLAWAGVADFPFARVTSYENSRACKPSLLYYQEIMESIGCPADACLMVGNEPDDLVAANLGCPTYLVTDGTPPIARAGDGAKTVVPPPSYRGTLAELPALLAEHKPA